jgi:AraC family transcriptional activator of tynA and feaB
MRIDEGAFLGLRRFGAVWENAGMDANFRSQGARLLGFEEWRASLDALGLQATKHDQRETPSWSIDRFSLYGSPGVMIGCGAGVVVQRNELHARRDHNDSYCVVIQLHGQSALQQNDRIARLSIGDVVFIDMSRPASRHLVDHSNGWFGFQLPRPTLISHLGLEPEGGLCCRGNTPAGRLLLNLIRDSFSEPASSEQTQAHMQLAFYDLLGALLGATDRREIPAARSDRLFKRICCIVKHRFSDAHFGPVEAAAEAGISVRYLQKLFTARGLSCARFILSVRLDEAARQLNRRALIRAGRPLKEVAYACGFTDYPHFSRAFRRRFGRSPTAVCGRDGRPVVPALR